MGTHVEPPERTTESVILICWRAIMLLIASSVNGPPVCPVANVTCHVAAGGAINSIVLAFAVSMIDFEATGMPHLSQNRASLAIVDPQLVQTPISTSHLMLREKAWNTTAGAVSIQRPNSPN